VRGAVSNDRPYRDFLNSKTAIFPIICGDLWKALKLAHYCQRNGIFVQAIGQPVVPKRTPRLRAVVTAAHSTEDLEFCVSVLHKGAKDVGGILIG
jgi:glycine C-acetyltransferase